VIGAVRSLRSWSSSASLDADALLSLTIHPCIVGIAIWKQLGSKPSFVAVMADDPFSAVLAVSDFMKIASIY